jgi:predicted  nucleic acid-binding Zn-ribbon protein
LTKGEAKSDKLQEDLNAAMADLSTARSDLATARAERGQADAKAKALQGDLDELRKTLVTEPNSTGGKKSVK